MFLSSEEKARFIEWLEEEISSDREFVSIVKGKKLDNVNSVMLELLIKRNEEICAAEVLLKKLKNIESL